MSFKGFDDNWLKKTQLRIKDDFKPKELVKTEPKGIIHIKSILDKNCLKFETEYRISKLRKWRFDIAVPSLKLLVEYDGLGFEGNKMLGHQTIKGINNDHQKQNHAIINGWQVLRYTAVTYTDFEKNLKEILQNDSNKHKTN